MTRPFDTLLKLVYRKDYRELNTFMAEGVDLNEVDEDGRTLLMHAVLASDADPEMIHFLLEKGMDPNRNEPSQKWTAMHFAARDQKIEIVKALLQHNALVDMKDSFGNTPLWRCVMDANTNPALVKLLVDNGADPNAKNQYGASPKDIAERLGKAEACRFL